MRHEDECVRIASVGDGVKGGRLDRRINGITLTGI